MCRRFAVSSRLTSVRAMSRSSAARALPALSSIRRGLIHPNAQGLKAHIAFLHQIMPDTTCQIEDLVAGGDRVWARLRGRGTHTGAFMGRPPTGKHIDLDILDVCRFEDGKIAEHRA